jgi:hypothetical protein
VSQYWPAAQAVHVVAPAMLNAPSPHASQLWAPAAEEEFAGHLGHMTSSRNAAEAVPAGHE